MARVNDWAGFARGIRGRAKEVVKGVELRVIHSAIAASDTVIETTPFLTGQAKSGWNASFGTPKPLNPKPFVSGNREANNEGAKSRNRAIILGWRIGKGTIFIANGVPHIRRLEDGSSAQAPNGMTKQALAAARQARTSRPIFGAK